MKRSVIISVWLVSALLCGVIILAQIKRDQVSLVEDGVSTGKAQIGGEFTLTSHLGTPFNTKDIKKPKIVYFGYTFCPDICPMGLLNITKALEMLGRDKDKVLPIFVTIDPERDTVDVLKQYHEHFHPQFMMLTGTKTDVENVSKMYKVYFSRRQDPSSVDYLVDHSTLVYLMDKDGRYVAHYPHSTIPDKLAYEIRRQLLS